MTTPPSYETVAQFRDQQIRTLRMLAITMSISAVVLLVVGIVMAISSEDPLPGIVILVAAAGQTAYAVVQWMTLRRYSSLPVDGPQGFWAQKYLS